MDMYGSCKRRLELHKLFRDLPNHDMVSWASFMSSFAGHLDTSSVFNLLQEMEEDGIMPDHVMFLCILKACLDMSGVQGRVIHDHIIKANFESDMAVANSLVGMYAKGGCFQEAEKVFSKVKKHNLISCSAMISGYVQGGCSLLAWDLFETMQDEGIRPDKVTFLGALRACSSMGAIRKGRQIHSALIKDGFDTEVGLGNTLVDLYAKCGCLQDAQKVFDILREIDSISWCALLSGYAQQGSCTLAEKLVERMQSQGSKPDDAVFMSILAGCSHAGLLKNGHSYFEFMRQGHNMSPSIEHCNCMVDLLGRMGHLVNAKDMLQTAPASSNFIGWSTLLSGCRSHGDVELGTSCFSELSHLDSSDASSYMLMSSLYSSVQLKDDASELPGVRKKRQAQEKPGEAWIEIARKIHEFTVSDCVLQNSIFSLKSKRISMLVKEHGYLPDIDMLYQSTEKR
ncbi:hypothetical protein L7F22_003711 [Adiantum nelumboides]|nr:hypothetical protein [Adiantum nelumboides]